MAQSTVYVLDTNVLLHDPRAIFSFRGSNIILPIAVIEEIDNVKKRQDEVGGNARQVSRYLDKLRKSGGLSEGITLDHGGTLRVELNHQEKDQYPYGLDTDKYDNRILAVAYRLSRELPDVRVVSKDINLRIKADAIKLPAEDYETDKVAGIDEQYTGTAQYSLLTEDVDKLFKEHSHVLAEEDHGLLPNQFVVVKDTANPSHSILARYRDHRLWTLKYRDTVVWGIKARNKEQRFALDLLMDPEVQLVTLVGGAGTGKTLLAIAAALEQVVERSLYRRILVTRPIMPVGADIGFLPGEKVDKLKPWMQPIYDNLDFLSRLEDEHVQSADVITGLVERDLLEVEALTYIRGRTLPKQFIIIDEAQNLTPHMIKTIITRVGEHSKIVFTGDLYQIDNPYLDATSSGLAYLVDRFKHQDIAGHVTLIKGERSKLAELGSQLL